KPRITTSVVVSWGLSDEMVNSLAYVVGSEPSTARVARARLVRVGPGPTDAEKEVRSAKPNVMILLLVRFSTMEKWNDARSARPTVERPLAKEKVPLPVQVRPGLSGCPVPK